MHELAMQRYIAPYNFAVVYAGLGDKNEAFEWLNRAYDARSYLLVEYLNTDSRLDSLHDGPRFSTLRSRAGLPAPQTNKPQ